MVSFFYTRLDLFSWSKYMDHAVIPNKLAQYLYIDVAIRFIICSYHSSNVLTTQTFSGYDISLVLP